MRLMCRLKGSDEYCEIGRGLCCTACGAAPECPKACLNSPISCGYAGCGRSDPETISPDAAMRSDSDRGRR